MLKKKKVRVARRSQIAHAGADVAAVSSRKVAWSVAGWCRDAEVGRSTYYTLGELAPRSVKLGRKVIIIEPPGDWLARLAERSKAA